MLTGPSICLRALPSMGSLPSSSLDHTTESSQRTVSPVPHLRGTSTVVCAPLILQILPQTSLPLPPLPARSFHPTDRAGPSPCSGGSMERPAGLSPCCLLEGTQRKGLFSHKGTLQVPVPPQESRLHPSEVTQGPEFMPLRIPPLSLLF